MRFRPEERQLLELAALRRKETLSEYLRRAGLSAARRDLGSADEA